MNIDIGAYDPATRAVRVTFTTDEITHARDVNACHDANGEYDPQATADRAREVGRGVAQKIAVGAIVAAPLVEFVPDEAPADESTPA